MPGMSGFELLAAVRGRFDGLRTIAMSGAFSGVEVPLGVAADAFYQKGSGVELLLGMIEANHQRQRMQVDSVAAQLADQDLSSPFQPLPPGPLPQLGAMQTINC
jgi:hypothetical protein